MGNVLRWDRSDPSIELEEIGQRLIRTFSGREVMAVAGWAPAIDISEDTKEYIIKAQIFEVDQKDVRVTLEGGVLTIHGEGRKEKEEQDKRFHSIERAFDTFVRSFSMPADVTEDNVRAEFKDGMLWIHLPKAQKPKPKSIEVKVA